MSLNLANSLLKKITDGYSARHGGSLSFIDVNISTYTFHPIV